MGLNSLVTSGLTTESEPVQPSLICGRAEYQGVTFHQRCHGVIPATNDGGHWNSTPQAGIENEMVPLKKPEIRQSESSQPIIPVRVNSRVVENQLRAQAIQNTGKVVSDRLQVSTVLETIAKRKVEIADLLAGGKV